MKVMLGGNINDPRRIALATALVARGIEVLHAQQIPIEPDPFKLEMIMHAFKAAEDSYTKHDVDNLERKWKNDSIVRNPCLPQRWKKGKIS